MAGTAQAKNLYVNNSGNPACSDATTYAVNSATQPWCTIMRAARGSTTYNTAVASQAAQPGDVVLIQAGIYWENGQVGEYARFSVHLNPINNGTSSAPITFRGVGDVHIRMNAGFRGGTIGCSNRNYIIWDNFKIDDYYQGSTGDTGPVVFNATEYCQLLNSDIQGRPGDCNTANPYYHGYPAHCANYRCISLEPARHTTIRNNLIHGCRGGQNEAGIMFYDAHDNIIENNTIYDNGVGVFIKGDHTGDGWPLARNIIRRNLVYNNRQSGIRSLGGDGNLIYQNIVRGVGPVGDAAGLINGWGTNLNTRWINNTVYATHSGVLITGADLLSGVQFQNNIIASTTNTAYYNVNSSPSSYDVQFMRNLYFNNPRHWYSEGGPTQTLSQVQGVGKESGSINADPLFVNAASFDFHLQAGSPARTVGIDVLDLNGNGSTTDMIPAGAYVTGNEIIGASVAVAPRLRAPANLRIAP